VEVCGKRVTLADEVDTQRSAGGTEDADGMLSGQRFGLGGQYHSRMLDRWAANASRPESARHSGKAMPSKLGQLGVSS
jgi:hypothetical protein